jgi:hypothetical protein
MPTVPTYGGQQVGLSSTSVGRLEAPLFKNILL